MATVNQTIISILEKKRSGILDGSAAVTGLLTEVKKQILVELVSLPNESYASYNLRNTLRSIEGYLSGWESRAGRLVSEGLGYMWGEGAAMLPDMAKAAGIFTPFGHVGTAQLETLKDFAVHKISGLASDTMARIQGEISLGVLGQKTPTEIAGKIAGSLTDPGIFDSIATRAETITHTELGRAFSMATDASIESAMGSLPELQKMWVHAGHPKQSRPTHLAAHGQHVAADGAFLLGGVIMRHPRDPAAPIKEVIHCGCDEVPYMTDWYSPQEFLKDWEAQQKKTAARHNK